MGEIPYRGATLRHGIPPAITIYPIPLNYKLELTFVATSPGTQAFHTCG